MISKGAQGAEPTLLKLLLILGGSAPLCFCITLAFHGALTLPPMFCIAIMNFFTAI